MPPKNKNSNLDLKIVYSAFLAVRRYVYRRFTTRSVAEIVGFLLLVCYADLLYSVTAERIDFPFCAKAGLDQCHKVLGSDPKHPQIWELKVEATSYCGVTTLLIL